MLINELLNRISDLENADKLPKYILVSDVSDSQVLIGDEWKNVIDSWGILYKDNTYIYFETDSERGYLSYIKKFDNEQSVCEYAYGTLKVKGNTSVASNPLDMAIKYIENKYGYSNNRAKKMAEQIFRHDEIFEEFFNYIRIGKMRKKDRTQVTICDYTAEKLFNEYDLSPLGAYNFLVYLKEEPERALEDLRNGLPKR